MFTLPSADPADDSSRAAAAIAWRPMPQRIAKPWGEELVLSRSEQAICKVLRIRGRRRLSLQYHRRKRETLIVLRGRVRLTLGDSLDSLRRCIARRGDRAAIPAGVIHRLEALGGDAEVLEFAFDADLRADDVVRLSDDYGRADAIAGGSGSAR